MPAYTALGYKQGEPKFMIDFHRQRAMIKADAGRIEGAVHLERIAFGREGKSPAMLLTKRDWGDIYLVNFRSEWDEDDYFSLADSLFKKHGINNP